MDMQDVRLTRLDGSTVTVAAGAVEAFAAGLRGRVLDAAAEGYDEARAIWNAMVDRRPGLIVRCRGVADVIHAVRFAREHAALVAVRGGGHNIAGTALCDGGLVIAPRTDRHASRRRRDGASHRPSPHRRTADCRFAEAAATSA
jgi:hypothetical protein